MVAPYVFCVSWRARFLSPRLVSIVVAAAVARTTPNTVATAIHRCAAVSQPNRSSASGVLGSSRRRHHRPQCAAPQHGAAKISTKCDASSVTAGTRQTTHHSLCASVRSICRAACGSVANVWTAAYTQRVCIILYMYAHTERCAYGVRGSQLTEQWHAALLVLFISTWFSRSLAHSQIGIE